MTTAIVPPQRPAIDRAAIEAFLHDLLDVDVEAFLGAHPVTVVGRRGYYRDTMGDVGTQERGIYDDALCIVTPDAVTAYNANTDPTVTYRRGVAVLEPGIWQYQLGIHGLSKPAAFRYEALVQAGQVTVRRDGQGLDTGYFGINIHRGGFYTTSSLGCQTIYPSQWDTFIADVKAKMRAAHVTQIPYVLTART